jgi:phosphoribosylformimino-5-aminoimidazole carboxamide ribotide isomerase
MILPVLDIMSGQVVRGIAGRRHEYRPLTPISDPLAVAETFRDPFELTTLYLADLDAIAGRPPALALYGELLRAGFALWVDAGLKRAVDAGPLVETGIGRVIAGLETLDDPRELEEMVRTWSPAKIVFSLDLKGGAPLASEAWETRDPLAIAGRAVAAGAASLLVLDLSRVGVGQGIGTEAVCRECRRRWPKLELTAGGGVRGADDLRRLAELGVDHVLVASALHDGRLSREDVVAHRGLTPFGSSGKS